MADFGIPKWQVSDQGSHFKNEVIAELNRALRSNHHSVSDTNYDWKAAL
jgi:hypothetical protein